MADVWLGRWQLVGGQRRTRSSQWVSPTQDAPAGQGGSVGDTPKWENNIGAGLIDDGIVTQQREDGGQSAVLWAGPARRTGCEGLTAKWNRGQDGVGRFLTKKKIWQRCDNRAWWLRCRRGGVIGSVSYSEGQRSSQTCSHGKASDGESHWQWGGREIEGTRAARLTGVQTVGSRGQMVRGSGLK
jgi:hypothetical protein